MSLLLLFFGERLEHCWPTTSTNNITKPDIDPDSENQDHDKRLLLLLVLLCWCCCYCVNNNIGGATIDSSYQLHHHQLPLLYQQNHNDDHINNDDLHPNDYDDDNARRMIHHHNHHHRKKKNENTTKNVSIGHFNNKNNSINSSSSMSNQVMMASDTDAVADVEFGSIDDGQSHHYYSWWPNIVVIEEEKNPFTNTAVVVDDDHDDYIRRINNIIINNNNSTTTTTTHNKIKTKTTTRMKCGSKERMKNFRLRQDDIVVGGESKDDGNNVFVHGTGLQTNTQHHRHKQKTENNNNNNDVVCEEQQEPEVILLPSSEMMLAKQQQQKRKRKKERRKLPLQQPILSNIVKKDAQPPPPPPTASTSSSFTLASYCIDETITPATINYNKQDEKHCFGTSSHKCDDDNNYNDDNVCYFMMFDHARRKRRTIQHNNDASKVFSVIDSLRKQASSWCWIMMMILTILYRRLLATISLYTINTKNQVVVISSSYFQLFQKSLCQRPTSLKTTANSKQQQQHHQFIILLESMFTFAKRLFAFVRQSQQYQHHHQMHQKHQSGMLLLSLIILVFVMTINQNCVTLCQQMYQQQQHHQHMHLKQEKHVNPYHLHHQHKQPLYSLIDLGQMMTIKNNDNSSRNHHQNQNNNNNHHHHENIKRHPSKTTISTKTKTMNLTTAESSSSNPSLLLSSSASSASSILANASFTMVPYHPIRSKDQITIHDSKHSHHHHSIHNNKNHIVPDDELMIYFRQSAQPTMPNFQQQPNFKRWKRRRRRRKLKSNPLLSPFNHQRSKRTPPIDAAAVTKDDSNKPKTKSNHASRVRLSRSKSTESELLSHRRNHRHLTSSLKPPYADSKSNGSSDNEDNEEEDNVDDSKHPKQQQQAKPVIDKHSQTALEPAKPSIPRHVQIREFSSENFHYTNITAQVGHPAYMPCVIDSLGDKMVSWIRLRDFHLLTIGSLTYIQDDRFAVRYGGYQSNDWVLQIKHVTVKDEGLYECQINSNPPKSQYYYLHIVVPVTEIIGNPNIFVRLGESINLTCLITSSPEPPAFVFWYHNERMINYDYANSPEHGHITVQKSQTEPDTILSRLVITKAKLEASGNYTCSPSNAEPASTYVHVLQGEKRLSNDVQNDWSSTNHHHSHHQAGSSGGGGILLDGHHQTINEAEGHHSSSSSSGSSNHHNNLSIRSTTLNMLLIILLNTIIPNVIFLHN